MKILNSICAIASVCIVPIELSCTARYQPVLEIWPMSDASSTVSPLSSSSSADNDGSAPTSSPSDAGGSAPTADAGTTGAPGPGTDGGFQSAAEAGAPKLDAAVSDAGSGSMDGSTGGFDAGNCGGGCCVALTVTTVPDYGTYFPENVGAIWIAKSSGTFVKTLERWAQSRINHLTLWNSVTAAAGLSRNTVDAITGASLSIYTTHVVSWNCKDTKQAVVPDGPYRVYFETTDKNSSGPNAYVDFTKGPTRLSLSPPNTPYFTNIRLTFTP